MTLDPIKTTEKYALPLERLFSTEGMHKILDCLMSNYELEQNIDDVAKFTNLENSTVDKCLSILVAEKLITKRQSTYKTRMSSERLSGLFSYYRATMAENLLNLEFRPVDLK